MTRDDYTVSVIRQDYANHLGTPLSADTVTMLRDYVAKRKALRVKYRLKHPKYVNTDRAIRALAQRQAA